MTRHKLLDIHVYHNLHKIYISIDTILIQLNAGTGSQYHAKPSHPANVKKENRSRTTNNLAKHLTLPLRLWHRLIM